MARLSEDDIRDRLRTVPQWTRQGDQIRRTYELPSFAEAIAFVNRVAGIADAADHHPDILIEYRRVTLTLSTHDAGGLTERDFRVASSIDA